MDVPRPRRGESDDTIFLTNGVLCLKEGRMQAQVPTRYFRTCGTCFLRPLIELIRPMAVVTLGRRAFDGALTAFGVACTASLAELVDRRATFDLPGGARLFPRFHPSRTVLNTVRSLDQQIEVWRAIREWLRADQERCP
jgi:uracil-DNA glycosylase